MSKRVIDQGRQGDVFIAKATEATIRRMARNGKTRIKAENGQLILAKGELSGHDHALASEGNKLFMLGDGETMLLEVTAQTELVHPEHEALLLDEGTYVVARQREAAGAAVGHTRMIYD